MVLLHIKRNDQSLFLLQTTLRATVEDTLLSILRIYNGRLKVDRITSEITDLAHHGIYMPQSMRGLLEEQIQELKLTDAQEEICVPSGGYDMNKDPCQRRNGRQPKENMRELLHQTIHEAKSKISNENVKSNTCLTWEVVSEALDILRGVVNIVYPMGLPEYDPIKMELENRENLAGTQASKDVIESTQAVIWFSTKELQRDKKLEDYLGKNEKSKVIIKLCTRSQGQPTREPVFSEEEQKRLMLANHKRREEMLALEKDVSDDSYLNSQWADQNALKSRMQGINNVNWK